MLRDGESLARDDSHRRPVCKRFSAVIPACNRPLDDGNIDTYGGNIDTCCIDQLSHITMLNRLSKPAHALVPTINRFAGSCLVLLSVGLGGCAFFDQPLDNLGTITPGAPPSSTAPPPLSGSSDTPPTTQPNALPPGVSEIGDDDASVQAPPLNPPTESANPSTGTRADTGALPTLPGQGAYLTVASLIDIPEDTTNLAFIHFTQSEDSARALAVCQATMKNLAFVPVENIPDSADTVLVWPVNNSDVGNSCLEMIANYEALDISNATAQRVSDSSRGPFLLTRNSQQSKRLIYDLSFIDRDKFAGAIDEWRSLLGSAAADWPEYRSAR